MKYLSVSYWSLGYSLRLAKLQGKFYSKFVKITDDEVGEYLIYLIFSKTKQSTFISILLNDHFILILLNLMRCWDYP